MKYTITRLISISGSNKRLILQTFAFIASIEGGEVRDYIEEDKVEREKSECKCEDKNTDCHL